MDDVESANPTFNGSPWNHGNEDNKPTWSFWHKKRSTTFKEEPLSYLKLFQFSTICDRVLTIVGLLSAILGSAAQPLVLIFIGDLLDRFVSYGMLLSMPEKCTYSDEDDLSPYLDNHTLPQLNASMMVLSPFVPPEVVQSIQDKFLADCTSISIRVSCTAALQAASHYVMVSFLSSAAESQSLSIRKSFVRSVLRQDATWFDTRQMGDFASKATAELGKLKEGLGEKVPLALYYCLSSFLCLSVAFFHSWRLSLLVLVFLPVTAVTFFYINKAQKRHTTSELSASVKAGLIAEEVISNMATVSAFSGEQVEEERYQKAMVQAQTSALRRASLTALGSAFLWLGLYSNYALAFWYGATTVIAERCHPQGFKASDLLTVFLCVMTAALNLGNLPPYLEAFSIALSAGRHLIPIIHQIPKIDTRGQQGERPADFQGRVQFKNVMFEYPSRPGVPILQDLNLNLWPGETVALVGPSGSGKSTILQLLQRFYDPVKGKVLVDDRDLRQVHLGWWRSHLAVVDQEPVLFTGTVAYNIGLGRPAVSEEDVEKAAIEANAHDFILQLPQSYDTVIGEGGSQLSGGQKQRLAIARALVRNPKILLLDEATSALDSESEAQFQVALEKSSREEGRLTVLVAHRLSTVVSADRILVLDKGRIVEEGTHQQLMLREGLYHHMFAIQAIPECRTRHRNLGSQITVRIGDGDDDSLQDFQTKNGEKEERWKGTLKSGVELRNFGEESKRKEKKVNKETVRGLRSRLVYLTLKDWRLVVTGGLSSFIMGMTYPGSAVLFGFVLQALVLESDEAYRFEELYAVLFVVMAVIAATASFFQVLLFSIAGERMTYRLRKMTFSSIVGQELSWFEKPENSAGSLCSRLSSDSANVQGATGSRVSMVCQALATLSVSLAFSLWTCWSVGLIATAFVPLLVALTVLKVRLLSGQLLHREKANQVAAQIAVEAIQKVRCVQSLQRETDFLQKYCQALENGRRSRWSPHVQGLVFGLAESIPFFSYIAVMEFGSRLVANGDLPFADLYKISQGIVVGTLMFSQSVAFASDFQKAMDSARRVFNLLDLKPTIDSFSKQGVTPDAIQQMSVTYSNVWFEYPSRPGCAALRDLSLTLRPGERVALVGPSGCGKTTCLRLLHRHYDCTQGSLQVNEVDVRNLNLSWLRSQVRAVPQEPVLFARTLAENIAYGDNSRAVALHEVIQAATQAGIHQFVSSLPLGYETPLGDRGTQLSGGQKQRVAIARALIGNPQILLLDEATSALDTQGEKEVLETLESIARGRTCVWVVHRLSGLANMDRIVVLNEGALAEEGTHQELLELKGIYYRLYALQNRHL